MASSFCRNIFFASSSSPHELCFMVSTSSSFIKWFCDIVLFFESRIDKLFFCLFFRSQFCHKSVINNNNTHRWCHANQPDITLSQLRNKYIYQLFHIYTCSTFFVGCDCSTNLVVHPFFPKESLPPPFNTSQNPNNIYDPRCWKVLPLGYWTLISVNSLAMSTLISFVCHCTVVRISMSWDARVWHFDLMLMFI